jgi:hypothetical protein
MSVSASYDFDSREHYRASRAATRFTAARWISWIAVLFGVGMVAWIMIRGWNEPDPLPTIVAALPYALLALVWATITPFMQHRAAHKLPARDPSVRGTQDRRVDEAGYHSRGNGVQLDIPWHAMVRGVEHAEFFLFFYNKQCAYYLPKRTLAPEEIAEVRRLMHAGLGPKARLVGG